MQGILILGGRATGKTTLELNLREALFGTCRSGENWQANKQVCIIGRTTRTNGKGRVLATAGSERLGSLVGLPKRPWYISSVTPAYDAPGIIPFFHKLDKVFTIHLFTDKRQEYYETRCMGVSGKSGCILGPASPCKPLWKEWNFYYRTEEMHTAFEFILYNLLNITEKDFDYDIFSRTVFQQAAEDPCSLFSKSP